MPGDRESKRRSIVNPLRRLLGTWRERSRGDSGLLALTALGMLVGMLALILLLGRGPSAPRVQTLAASLEEAGLDGVTLSIAYPSRLTPADDEMHPQTVTLLFRSASVPSLPSFDVWLDAGAGLFFVDSRGQHVAGHIAIPQAARVGAQDLLVAHAGLSSAGRNAAPRSVTVQPLVISAQGTMQLTAQSFDIALVNRGEYVLRRVLRATAVSAAALVTIGCSAYLMAFASDLARRRRQHEALAQAAMLYDAVREHIQASRWADARLAIDRLRSLVTAYRDVDELERVVSAAETAAWRRDHLYAVGAKAYQERDWATAARAFSALQAEDPYVDDVSFLKRTSELYIALKSHDRSARTSAARQLGEVGDLVDPEPLLEALGDPSEQVAEAASGAFRAMGPSATEALVRGLAHNSTVVRERAYRLLEESGQNAKPHLLAALRSSDAHMSAAAARLLGRLGARQELAEALLYATPAQRGDVMAALVQEGLASCSALVQTLLAAEPAQQHVVLEGIAALKAHCDVDRYLDDLLRRTKDAAQRELLQRALKTPAESIVALSSAGNDARAPTISPPLSTAAVTGERISGASRALRLR